MLLPETDLERGLIAAERFRAAVEGTTVHGARGGSRSLTISLGVGCYPDHATSIPELMELTDAALYTAKRTGRNRACTASSSAEVPPPAPQPTPRPTSTVLQRLNRLIANDVDSPLAATRMAARMLHEATTPGDAVHAITSQLHESSEEVRRELLKLQDELTRLLEATPPVSAAQGKRS